MKVGKIKKWINLLDFIKFTVFVQRLHNLRKQTNQKSEIMALISSYLAEKILFKALMFWCYAAIGFTLVISCHDDYVIASRSFIERTCMKFEDSNYSRVN